MRIISGQIGQKLQIEKNNAAIIKYPFLKIKSAPLLVALCHHGTPSRSSLPEDIVQNRGTFHAPSGVPRGYTVLSRLRHTDSAVGGHDGGPSIGCPLPDTLNQDGGLSHRVAVHGNWDRTWGSRVAQILFYTLQNRASRPPISLQRLQRQVFHLSLPGMICFGLIKTCHSELCDGVSDLAGKISTTWHVSDDPLIHQGCSV